MLPLSPVTPGPDDAPVEGEHPTELALVAELRAAIDATPALGEALAGADLSAVEAVEELLRSFDVPHAAEIAAALGSDV